MAYNCSECDKEFDTERGLNVHITQVHDGDAATEQQVTKEASLGNLTFRLNYIHALALTFGVAFLLGGFLTATALHYTAPGELGVTGAAAQADAPDNNSGDGQQTVSMDDFDLEGQPMLGDEDAPVTIVSYEDFFCPYCAKYNTETFPQIVEEYVESGQVRYVYKHLPVVGGMNPAIAAECVAEQDHDAFWDYKQKLFENQDQYKSMAGNQDELQTALVELAGEVGVDQDQFETCYENEETREQVQADAEEAQANGAQATPWIFVNGESIRGAQPFSAFQEVIENELSE